MKKLILKIILALFSFGLPAFFVIACGGNPLSSGKSHSKGSFRSDEIEWVSWEPEYQNQNNTLDRVRIGKLVSADVGGSVGGTCTYNNGVTIPAGALTEDIYISVEVLYTDEIFGQFAGGVEFLPSMTFQKPVYVSMSYRYLNYDGIPEDLEIYWSDDNGDTWYLIPNLEFDIDLQTAEFQVNHFTVFAWGEGYRSSR